MHTTLVGILSILSYLTSAGFILKEIISNQSSRKPLYFAWLAVCAHAAFTLFMFDTETGFSFGFFNTAALIMLMVALLLLISVLDKPVEKLGIAIFPIAALALALDLALPSPSASSIAYSGPMTLHILTSITAFSLLNIAALQAILLAIQDQQLKNHQPMRLLRSLPPLQAMEALLFQMIGSGLFFLSISLISGFIFLEDVFAQHLAHKTVLSIAAWVIFSSLLFGRLRYGWRGQTAIRWTLSGFLLLLLAYFGSKFVLELILNKTA